MTQHRTPSLLIYHQELAILSRFFNGVDRFIHAATFGEGERFAYTRELMAVLRAVFLGQIEGRPMGIARLSRHLAMPRATTERKLRELEKLTEARGIPGSFLSIERQSSGFEVRAADAIVWGPMRRSHRWRWARRRAWRRIRLRASCRGMAASAPDQIHHERHGNDAEPDQ